MSDQFTMERADLAKKDKGELQTIIAALGGKSTARMKKDALIDSVLELSGLAISEPELPLVEASTPGEAPAEPTTEEASPPESGAAKSASPVAKRAPRRDAVQSYGDRDEGDSQEVKPDQTESRPPHPVTKTNGKSVDTKAAAKPEEDRSADGKLGSKKKKNGSQPEPRSDQNSDGDEEPGNRRRRGRGRDNANEGPETTELVEVSGHLDLHDSGYGFLRVDGHRQSSNDVYVSVKMARTLALRPGDFITGMSRPAQRNEKNPALQQVETVSGIDPDEAAKRPLFDELTPVHPAENLIMERSGAEDPSGRILDLFTPLAKGQRGLIIGSPKTGKTEMIAEQALSVEANHPESTLFVVQLDERPEETTKMRRRVPGAEVVSSPFGRPADEHVSAVELTLERAKRLVETGGDVVILLDGLDRLVRAFNMAGHNGNRAPSRAVDAASIYAAKRCFGAARNTEEGGSLTIFATLGVAAAGAGVVDGLIVDEFVHAASVEIYLSERLAELSVFPAVDLARSSTRDENLLMDSASLEMVRRVRSRFVSEASDDASSPLIRLLEAVAGSPSNQDLLKQFA